MGICRWPLGTPAMFQVFLWPKGNTRLIVGQFFSDAVSGHNPKPIRFCPHWFFKNPVQNSCTKEKSKVHM